MPHHHEQRQEADSSSSSGPAGGAPLGISISSAVAILAAANLLSKILGFIRIRVLAQLGGTGPHVDAYAFSFIIPELLNHFLAAGMLSITFIPIFQKYLVRGERDRAWYVFSNILTIGTLASAVCIGGGMLFSRQIIMVLGGENITGGGDPEILALTIRLTRIILPAQMFFFWGALLMGVQYAHKKFLMPSLAGIAYNGGIILGGILLAPYIGIEGFSWGVLGGACIGNAALQVFGAARSGMNYRFVFNLRDPDFVKYCLLTVPLILGLNLSFSNEFLFRFFGSRIPNAPGAIASLEYSWRLMYIVVSIFGQSIAAGFYPFLSQLIAEKKIHEVNALLHSVFTKISAVLFPLSGIIAVLAVPIVTVLLRTGKFDDNSVAATAGPLTLYLIGTFFFAAVPLVNRIFYADNNTVLPLIVNTGSVAVCIPLYILLNRILQTRGIALASSVCMVLQFASMYCAYSMSFRPRFAAATLKNIALSLLSASAGTALCVLCMRAARPYTASFASPTAQAVATILLSAPPSLALSAFVCHATGILYIKQIIRIFGARGRT